MSDDIVARLRGWRGLHIARLGELFDEAAGEIERLRGDAARQEADQPRPAAGRPSDDDRIGQTTKPAIVVVLPKPPANPAMLRPDFASGWFFCSAQVKAAMGEAGVPWKMDDGHRRTHHDA
jgi:hypothetical protein